MARETSRQDRNARQSTGARSASGGRAGGAMGNGERAGRSQAAGEARASASGQRERESQGGTLRESQTGSAREREQAIQSGRETGGRQSGQATGLSARGAGSAVRGPGTTSGSNPFLLMQRMAEDMDRLFEQFGFGRTGVGMSPSFGSLAGPEQSRGMSRIGRADQSLWTPQVEVLGRGGNIVIRADLPGVNKEDVHVDVEDDVLTIRGERREESEEDREGFYRSERSYGSFYRALPLPEGVDPDAVEATYKDGVLEITLPAPKQQEQRARRIQIR